MIAKCQARKIRTTGKPVNMPMDYCDFTARNSITTTPSDDVGRNSSRRPSDSSGNNRAPISNSIIKPVR